MFVLGIFRFESDVLIESIESTITSLTITYLKELLEKTQNNTIKRDGPIQIEDYLTGFLVITLR